MLSILFRILSVKCSLPFTLPSGVGSHQRLFLPCPHLFPDHSIVRAMPSHSLQEIVANLMSVGIALRPELSPYNTPIAPPPGLHPHPVAASAPEPKVLNSRSSEVKTAAPASTANHIKPQPNEKPKQAEKSKAAIAEKKPNERTERKTNEKQQQQQQQQIGEKKLSQSNPQPAPRSAAQTSAPAKVLFSLNLFNDSRTLLGTKSHQRKSQSKHKIRACYCSCCGSCRRAIASTN